MKLQLVFIGLLGIVIFAFTAEQKIRFLKPTHFPEPIYPFSKNPLSEKKIEIGRMLFYDPILSANQTISCASCHTSYNSFAHTDHALSHGIEDRIGTRNAPALFNLAWQPIFMWDGAINHLDMQSLAPISHPDEMGETILHVTQKLQQTELYPPRFQEAFGDSVITGEYVLKALSQFMLTLVSANTKYDSVKRGQAQFSAQENSGYTLYKQHCASCHTEPLFTNYTFKNNGLPLDSFLHDVGRIKISQQASDSLCFKVPSLRNLNYTYPYMHDGRFKTVKQVLTHYTEGIVHYRTLSKELQTPITLTSNEKVDLIAFLNTLNDNVFVFNPLHSFPAILKK
jgi:cytochrome c peroxidase